MSFPPAGCGLCAHIVGVRVCACELDEEDIRSVRDTREERERKGKGSRGGTEDDEV